MKLIAKFVVTAVASLLLAGCLSSAFELGNSAAPPTNVIVIPGDSSATVTWTGVGNVQYWLFAAMATSITTENWNKLPGGRALINVSSPQLVTGLINDSTYSFTLNGRENKGPGGAGSPSISIVPRPAGGSWTAGAPLGNDLLAAAFGTVFVAVGAKGALYTSPDFNAWTPMAWTAKTLPLATPTDLYAATHSGAVYVVAGANGVLMTSPDAVTWTAQTTGTTKTLYGVASNGLGGYVAVGEQGTIVVSTDGLKWTVVNSGTTQDLFGVAYGNGVYVVAGAKGTLLSSGDTSTWTVLSSNTAADLRGIAYGVNSVSQTLEYVAVGAAGTVVISTDGTTWTPQTPLTSSNLNAVTYNRQFVIVGDAGVVITSVDGTAFQVRDSGTSSDLKAVTHNIYGLSALGLAGTNLTSL
jgi:hypothetical protein